MSLLPPTAGNPDDEREAATLVLDIREEADRIAWAQAARWRAGALAETIFGGRVVPRLRSARGGAGFTSLVELEVPFVELERHRELEERFVRAAGMDEVLSLVPALYLFTPREAV
jgi:hypothetical protein